MDYRKIHLDKGNVYDATIAGHPFDAYMARWEASYLRKIVPELLHGGGRYLDFACGTGRITATVAPLVRESVGVDISETMLAEARLKCPATRFMRVDLTREDADIGQFDLATSFRFFGNAQDTLRESALAALAKHVRSKGFLIVNNHRNPNALGALLAGAGGHSADVDLTHWKFERQLAKAGFEILHARPIGFWIIRAKQRNSPLIAGKIAAVAEGIFRHRIWAAWAPDCVIVARKR